MQLTELQQKYNELLAREKKAEAYIDDPHRTPAEIEKWMPEYQKILTELNDILGRIGNCTALEVCYGFGEEGNLGQQADLRHGSDRQNRSRR